MSLNAALNLILDKYPIARKQVFADHPVAGFIRDELPVTVQQAVSLDMRYLVEGSAGKGNWVRVPWVAVFDRFITESAQDGYYIVYLVKEDFSGVYLSLNQGVTTVKKGYGVEAKEALKTRATDFLARLGRLPQSCITGPIDLAVSKSSNLGAYYEQGSIFAKYYAKGSIPNDEELTADLREFLKSYLVLSTKELLPSTGSLEEDEQDDASTEDLRVFREHKRIERNQKLAKRAKQLHGYICQACGFDFSVSYGEIGKGFIEAHHLTPLSDLKGKLVTLDPKKDFSVLCSNCHRMIHRTKLVSNVEGFRLKHIVKDKS